MNEAGLPIVTCRGARGGIELGFNYRSRLTGLAEDEAEALAVWLAAPPVAVAAPGLGRTAARVRGGAAVHLKPEVLALGPEGWSVMGPPLAVPVPMAEWGDINISRAALA